MPVQPFKNYSATEHAMAAHEAYKWKHPPNKPKFSTIIPIEQEGPCDNLSKLDCNALLITGLSFTFVMSTFGTIFTATNSCYNKHPDSGETSDCESAWPILWPVAMGVSFLACSILSCCRCMK